MTKGQNISDYAFQPCGSTEMPKVVEMFVVAKLNTGLCHLVETQSDMDGEIYDFVVANTQNEKIILHYPELPINLIHFDGRKI